MSFTVSINPTYLCNFRCNFCYLTEEQLSDKSKIDPHVLDTRLFDISQWRDITHIDFYGGEITLLPVEYLQMLKEVIRLYYDGPISVITNLSRASHSFLLSDDVDVSVSWDYVCRERWEEVLRNVAFFPKSIHILMLASECMVNWSDKKIKEVQMIFERMRNIKTVEIKPYSTNVANQHPVTFQQYEEFIKRWIELTPSSYGNFEFVNKKQMWESLDGTRNAWSDDHVYITPRGEYAVLEFDKNDNEYFLLYDRIEDYLDWALKEKERVNTNEYCSSCPYLGHCLSEHLREVRNLNNSCNGFRFLLDWYAERLQA